MTSSRRAYFGRYVLVGIANTLIYSGMLFRLLQMGSLSYPACIGVAFSVAMVFQYLANKYFTFRSTQLSAGEVMRYMATAALNYAVSVAIVWLCLDVMHLGALVATFTSAIIVASVGFLVSMIWVYRK